MFIASEKEIKEGLTTDVYFTRTEEILKKKGINNNVVADFTVQGLKYPWGVFVGLPEVIEVLEGKNVSLYALPEGSIFTARDVRGYPVPVMVIEGPYLEFARFETPILGFICEASGIATKAARLRKIAKDKSLLSFGIRRMHPAIAPMIDRSAYIGGCDAVSSLIGASTIGKPPTGTIPHALIINMGGIVEAVKAFDEIIDPSVPRLALVDTFQDEKFESLLAAQTIGKHLYGVRLDTPGSRRGNIVDIAREVRWELDLRGFDHVKILVSGGLDEETVQQLVESGVVDGFGVGTSISNADTIDFAMDIVEVNGTSIAKRGKYSGRKKVYKRFENGKVIYEVKKNDETGTGTEALVPIILNGKVVYENKTPEEIRNFVLEQLAQIEEI
ncbi:MAG: nicotinate phosphoribosyltransferase [Caldisericum sp.]